MSREVARGGDQRQPLSPVSSCWRTAASTHWIVWKLRSSRSRHAPSAAISRCAVAARAEVRRDELARLVDLLLRVEQARQLFEQLRAASCAGSAAAPQAR